MIPIRVSLVAVLFASTICARAAPMVLEDDFLHLRNGDIREWTHYAETPDGKELNLTFDLKNPDRYEILTLRQEGTKQSWLVHLNNQRIAVLQRDHNHQEQGIEIPKDLLKKEGNTLRIFTESEDSDDIQVGEITLHDSVWSEKMASRTKKLQQVRGYTRALPKYTAELILKAVSAETGESIPCRFTILDAETGALVLLDAESDDRTAIREGVVYSLDGNSSVGVAGNEETPRTYNVYCGRGFEYSLEHREITIDSSNSSKSLTFELAHEVDTPGLVACDPHLHTFEFDRHGDCTLTERLISIAGEGVELPVSTGHDKHIEYQQEAARIGADRWMTTILGCEVTTSLGHFNTFPVEPGSPTAQHKLRPWNQIFQNIFATPGVRVCMLNHGRDVHRGYTPLSPEHFDAEIGVFKEGLKLEANAMELINSGAQQTDPMQLVEDWMSLLQSGHKIAGIGSSDSHTVNFAIPGQARTYIESDDSDPSSIDVNAAVDSLLAGNAHTSFGLLTLAEIDGDTLTVKVHGPSWTEADRLRIYRNGELAKTLEIEQADGKKAGEKYSVRISISDLNAIQGDLLVAVASGPGISEGWWPMMPPYQPDAPVYEPFVMGISKAIWLP